VETQELQLGQGQWGAWQLWKEWVPVPAGCAWVHRPGQVAPSQEKEQGEVQGL